MDFIINVDKKKLQFHDTRNLEILMSKPIPNFNNERYNQCFKNMQFGEGLLVSDDSGGVFVSYDFGDTFKVFRSTVTPRKQFHSFDWNEDHSLVCGSREDGRLVFWKVEEEELIGDWSLKHAFRPLNCVKFLESFNLVATGCDDSHFIIFDFEKQVKYLDNERAHHSYVMDICFNPKDGLCFSCGYSSGVNCWDVSSKKEVPLNIKNGNDDNFRSICCHEDKNLLFLGECGGFLRCIDLRSPEKDLFRVKDGKDEYIRRILINDNVLHNKVITGSGEKMIKLWDLDEQKVKKRITTEEEVFGMFLYSHSSRQILIDLKERTEYCLEEGMEKEEFQVFEIKMKEEQLNTTRIKKTLRVPFISFLLG